MTNHEQKAHELAERCAELCYEQRSKHAPIEHMTETILRELNLANLVEDEAILDEMQNNNQVHVIIHYNGVERMRKPYGTPTLPLRTAIRNAMKESEGGE